MASESSLSFIPRKGKVRETACPKERRHDHHTEEAKEKQDNCGVLRDGTTERSVKFPYRGFLWVDYKF